MQGSEQSGPSLVMEHDDDRGGGEDVRICLDPARLHPHVLEGPVDGDHLTDHQVELVDLELFLLELQELGRSLNPLSHLSWGALGFRNRTSRLVFMKLKC